MLTTVGVILFFCAIYAASMWAQRRAGREAERNDQLKADNERLKDIGKAQANPLRTAADANAIVRLRRGK